MNAKTKNYNSIFDLRLYLEGIKQLKLIGFISLGLLVLIALLTPIGDYISLSEQAKYGINLPQMTSIRSVSFFMYLIFMLITPIMTLMLFNFSTKRNACDYYHSFPQKRGCIYVSYAAAIATWIFAMVFISSLVTVITYACLSKYFVFSFSKFLYFALTILISSLLVEISITIACSITGNLFTNVIVSGLIIFLPRIIFTFFTTNIAGSTSILMPTKILPVLDYSYNMVFASTVDIVNNGGATIYPVSSLIYTIILAVIYFFLARFLFAKRKSETAGAASANRLLQAIIRLSIGLTVMLIPISFFFRCIVEGPDSYNSSDYFGNIVAAIVAVIFMLLFELISTKKVKNVIKALPSIPILILISGLFVLGEYAVYSAEISYSPEAEDIEYITLYTDENMITDYFSYKSSGYKFTDKEIIQIVSEALEQTIKFEKTEYPYHDMYNSKPTDTVYNFITVGIKSGLTVKYRQLWVENEEYAKFTDLLMQSDEFKDIYTTLPTFSTTTSMLYSDYDALSVEQRIEIYNSLREEIKTIDYAKWYEYLNDGYSQLSISLEYSDGDIYTYTRLPITTLTPKTLQKYFDCVNDLKSDTEKKELIDMALSMIEDTTVKNIVNVELKSFESDFFNADSQIYMEYMDPELLEYIKAHSDEEITAFTKDGYSLIRYELYINQNYDYDNYAYGYLFLPNDMCEKYGLVKMDTTTEEKNYME